MKYEKKLSVSNGIFSKIAGQIRKNTFLIKKLMFFFKVPLPQLGFEEPERICDDCLDVTSLVTKSRSLQMVRIVTVEPVL